jgi:hypothetical protein
VCLLCDYVSQRVVLRPGSSGVRLLLSKLAVQTSSPIPVGSNQRLITSAADNSLEQSLASDAYSRSASQEITHLLWKPKVHYRTLVPIRHNFSKINSNIILQSTLRSLRVVAGISQWYRAGLRAGWSGVRVPAGAQNLSLHHRVHNGSGAHPASYPMGTRGFFPGSKATGAWSWPPTSI